MAGVPGPNSGYPQVALPRWPLAGEDLAVFKLVRLFSGTLKSPRKGCQIKSRQARIYGRTPHTPLFWACSRTLPKGVELLV